MSKLAKSYMHDMNEHVHLQKTLRTFGEQEDNSVMEQNAKLLE